jgi:glycosyltransferase involved in cell wall biosynthesis
MRILHVTREVAGDRRYGLGKSLLPVCQALMAAGHEVRYITQEDLGPRARATMPRLTAGLRTAAGAAFGQAGRDIASAWAERINVGRLAAKMAKTDGYTVVHLHDPWIAWGFVQSSLLHRPGHALRWGFTEHGFGSYADATHEEGVRYTPRLMRWLRRLEARVAVAADWVVCPTAAGRLQLARDLAQPNLPPSWCVVPHARPVLNLPGRVAARQALGLVDDTPLVLAVGRINPVKRLDRIVGACVQLNRPLRLVLLAGSGDAAPLQALAAKAPQLQLDIRLAEDVGPYLSAADVYVSAARNESFGLANLEALVAGLPCVCTAVGGVPEVMGNAAYLLAPGDDGLDAGLAGAIAALLDDEPLRRAHAAAALARGANWPTAEQIGRRYEAVYRGVA